MVKTEEKICCDLCGKDIERTNGGGFNSQSLEYRFSEIITYIDLCKECYARVNKYVRNKFRADFKEVK